MSGRLVRKASGFREVLWGAGNPVSYPPQRPLCSWIAPVFGCSVHSKFFISVLKILLKMVREKHIRIPMTDWKSYLFTEMCIS